MTRRALKVADQSHLPTHCTEQNEEQGNRINLREARYGVTTTTGRNAAVDALFDVNRVFAQINPVGEHTARCQRYQNWLKSGLSMPRRRQETRDWLQIFALQKEEDYLIDPSVGMLSMGLGWDKGADVDASVAMFDGLLNVVDVVWYRNLNSKCGSVAHSGDNLTGDGPADDEVLQIDVDSIPLHVHYLLFTVSIYSSNLSFCDLKGAYVRMMHGKAKRLMCHFLLTELDGQSLLMGVMTRKGGYWNFRALGHTADGRSIVQLLRNPANLDCLRQIPSVAPDFRQIVVIVVGGTNLAAKDAGGMFRGQASSDPYYILKYKDRTFKSEYITKTLNPTWKEHSFDMGAVMETERKALKITVFDYDSVTNDDFMGIAWIPASALYNLAPGDHKLSIELESSKDKRFRYEEVSGEIQLKLSVREVISE